MPQKPMIIMPQVAGSGNGRDANSHTVPILVLGISTS